MVEKDIRSGTWSLANPSMNSRGIHLSDKNLQAKFFV
jgi:hypothetical protein